MEVKSYDFKEVSLILGTRRISGFAEGSSINLAPNEDDTVEAVGADGDVSVSFTNNDTGIMTVTLLQTASDNLFLSQLRAAKSFVPWSVVDKSGNSLSAGRFAIVKRLPDQGFARDAAEREWQIFLGDLKRQAVVGGN